VCAQRVSRLRAHSPGGGRYRNRNSRRRVEEIGLMAPLDGSHPSASCVPAVVPRSRSCASRARELRQARKGAAVNEIPVVPQIAWAVGLHLQQRIPSGCEPLASYRVAGAEPGGGKRHS